MKSKSLAVTIPPVYCYLHQAHQLSIVLVDSQKLPWFYNNYAQIYSRYKSDELKFDFLSYDGMYSRFPCINQNWLTREFFNRSQQSLSKFIIDCINQGFYCEIIVDEYYIPSKKSYQKFSNPHQNLIYGYDCDLHLFKVLGFDQYEQFTRIEISFEDMEKGFVNSSFAGVGFFDCTTDIEYTNTDLDVNLPLLKTYLSDYLLAKNSFVHFRPQNAVFGMETYELYKQEFLTRGNSDIRPMHVFWEHKKVMVSRLKYYEENGILSMKNDLLQGYTIIEQDFSVLRSMIIKYNIKKDQNILNRISVKLDELIITEKELLEVLLCLI